MPTSINELFFDVLKRNKDGKIKWSDIKNYEIPKQKGIYVIALERPICSPMFSDIAIRDWISTADNILVDSKYPSVYDVKVRLENFWYPDETILYIGKTSGNSQTLRKRLYQFYQHKLGEKSPHRGGHWIKTLANLNELDVYWGIVDDEDPYEIEQQMIEYFLHRVSKESREMLYDQNLPIPFANLKHGNIRKKHGFKNQTK